MQKLEEQIYFHTKQNTGERYYIIYKYLPCQTSANWPLPRRLTRCKVSLVVLYSSCRPLSIAHNKDLGFAQVWDNLQHNPSAESAKKLGRSKVVTTQDIIWNSLTTRRFFFWNLSEKSAIPINEILIIFLELIFLTTNVYLSWHYDLSLLLILYDYTIPLWLLLRSQTPMSKSPTFKNNM